MINLIDEEPMPLKWFLCSKYFQDGGWELVKGELVAMSPARAGHEAVVQRVGYLFQTAIGKGACTVYGSNIGIRLWGDDSHISPDLSVCCDPSMIEDGWFIRVPELVAEVLSKSTKAYCLGVKREIYREFGAKEYWAIDIDEKWVLVENFERGTCERYKAGDTVKSYLFETFEFGVESILKNVI
jgi:Uma2 family endonuclease